MGFLEIRRRDGGTHRIFRHEKSGLTVTVPEDKEAIRPVHLSAIRRQISNFDIADVEEFDRCVSGQREVVP